MSKYEIILMVCTICMTILFIQAEQGRQFWEKMYRDRLELDFKRTLTEIARDNEE